MNVFVSRIADYNQFEEERKKKIYFQPKTYTVVQYVNYYTHESQWTNHLKGGTAIGIG